MDLTVKTFNEDKLKEAIKNSPKIIKEYIRALKHVIEIGGETRVQAMKKIRELSLERKGKE